MGRNASKGGRGTGSTEDMLLDRQKMRELCAEVCGNRDGASVIDEREIDREVDKIYHVLSLLTEQMVDNLVDFSCLYAQHRKSDTLEKQDIQFATSKLFPDVSKEYKVKNVQMIMDQHVMQNYPLAGMPSTSQAMMVHPENAAYASLGGVGGIPIAVQQGTAIGVGGQTATMGYKA